MTGDPGTSGVCAFGPQNSERVDAGQNCKDSRFWLNSCSAASKARSLGEWLAIVGTAGNTGKRGYVRALGVQSVCSTRSTAFSETFHSGADLIINSLTSAGMIASSLNCLSAGGRFVELGKRDIWSANLMKMERPDLVYNLVALDFLPPSHVQKIMTELSHALALGTVKPLTSIIHGMNQISCALRQMSAIS